MRLRTAFVSLAVLAIGCSGSVKRTPPPADDAGSDAGVSPPSIGVESDAGVSLPSTDVESDAGVAPPIADAGVIPEPPLDAGPPVPGCSEPIALAVEDGLSPAGLAISQGRYAVTWDWWRYEGGEYFRGSMLAILDEGARLVAPARELESGPMLLALDDGFLVYRSSPGALQALDLDGRERGPALSLPEGWAIRSIGRDGAVVRAIGQESVADGEHALFVVDLAAASPTIERRELPAPDWGANRVLSAGRDLALRGSAPLQMAELSYPSAEIAFEHAWDGASIDVSGAQYDAARSEWILLAGEHRVMNGTYTAPIAVFLGSDGSGHKIDAPDAPMLRAVHGNFAIGEGSIGFAFWDLHTPALLWFLRGDAREPTVPRQIDFEVRPKIAWHAPSASYAVLTQSDQYDTPITLSLRCGIRPE
ncbi:hypothetical protein [Sorangium cellulosum]|uniref:Uncharacterized protein n=1 Tax=Sorangium cellulosum So0157-2 TaxID=1254432 RepID=S4XLC5_SORCE|nr:hypothetical protein [Sorangium cellulosum]AGP33286.1 hypothetical protein SCE1572_01445 [Sorangium cellulosum So0157-2]